MAFFDCQIVQGGASGTGIPLIVTCSEDFAGKIITATDGTTTLTAQCPSLSPYVVNFSLPNTGTWTVSGTISGTPYSAQITITDNALSLSAGFNWQDWVTAGGLDPSDYASLAAVFADEAAVRRLMLVHDSVDYLVDAVTADVDTLDDFVANDTAMKWLGLSDYATDNIVAITGAEAKLLASTYWERYLKDHVPVMTGNSAPYGVASTNSYGSGYDAWKAFDGDDTSYWRSSDEPPAWIAYKFVTPICVKRIKIKPALYGSGLRVLTYKVQGSNTGDTNDYTDIYSGSLSSADEQIVNITNNNYYLYYRVYVLTAAEQASAGIISLQFYGRQLSVSVPVMTGNTAPYGEASASSSNANAYKAFVHDNSATWMNESSDAVSSGNTYIQYSFGNKTAIKFVEIRAASYYPANFKLLGSDNSTFEEIGSYSSGWSGTPSGTQIKCISVNENNKAFKKIRFNPTTAVASSGYPTNTYVNMDIQFYGVDYSEKEFEAGATKKWLYDHGVELTPLTPNASSGCSSVIGSETIELNKISGTSIGAWIYNTDAIDFTPYKVARCTVGNELYYSNAGGSGGIPFCIRNAANRYVTANPSQVAGLSLEYGAKTFGLDISSITSSLYLGIAASTNTASDAKKADIAEIWVE